MTLFWVAGLQRHRWLLDENNYFCNESRRNIGPKCLRSYKILHFCKLLYIQIWFQGNTFHILLIVDWPSIKHKCINHLYSEKPEYLWVHCASCVVTYACFHFTTCKNSYIYLFDEECTITTSLCISHLASYEECWEKKIMLYMYSGHKEQHFAMLKDN